MPTNRRPNHLIDLLTMAARLAGATPTPAAIRCSTTAAERCGATALSLPGKEKNEQVAPRLAPPLANVSDVPTFVDIFSGA